MITVAAYIDAWPRTDPLHTRPHHAHHTTLFIPVSTSLVFHTISAVDYVLRPEGRELLLSPWTCLKLFKRTFRRW